ncbi:WD repeat-containing protein 86-like [Procambarus clarkii]|uniref:WD repeat-containing protein 86-like n=1 Tax=Procambarus clarkii TaxID=6728 RepID=UPI00374474E6
MGSSKSKQSDPGGYLQETLTDHSDSINYICLADDESILVTGSDDKTARLWATKDATGSECLGVLRGHTGYVTCVHVFDTCVVTGSSDGTVKRWDMTSCECEFTYTGHASQVMRVICTGQYVISSSKDTTAKVWLFDTDDLREGEEEKACIRTFKGHLKMVHPLIFIPSDDGKMEEEMVITGSADYSAKLWSVDSGGCLVTYSDHRGPIMTMATDNSARILFTGSADATVRTWHIRTGKLLKVFEGHTLQIMCLLVVNKLMYTADSAGVAKCWVWNLGDNTRDYKGHKHSVTYLRFNKGILYTGCGDGVIRCFEAKSGTLVRSFITNDSPSVINCFAVCDNKLFAGSQDGKLRVWDITNINEAVAPIPESLEAKPEAGQ